MNFRTSRRRSPLAATGALIAAISIALSAYAAHGLEGVPQSRIETATLYALVHGVALAIFAPTASRWLEQLAMSLWLIGLLLFSGSLIASVFAGWPTAAAPFGGGLMIAGWLVLALAHLKE